MNMDTTTLHRLLRQPCTIAVVGLSADWRRPSFEVSQTMQAQGYRIVPVNPRYAEKNEKILGESCYASLTDIPFPVDIVNVFRRTEDVLPVARHAVQIGAKCLWQQLGVENREADQLARAAGLDSVMNLCIKIEHARLAGGRH
ncbi:CoA-binding protein [Rhodoferax sp.]|uniref:CoA-binding protein n=1 Tax=Rhodoferax sp. TaxID=50421 RepID=UPI0025E9C3CA|nr:CoA-binding protein [Rhodoferax sp.]